MKDKLTALKAHFSELESLLSDPTVISDMDKYKKYSEEHGELLPIVQKIDYYFDLLKQLEDLESLTDDADEEVRELAKEEIGEIVRKRDELEAELPRLLLPKDPNDSRNVILEIRAGVGGDEAALFASELLRMYLRYAEKSGFATELLSSSHIGIGGIKEAAVLISGRGAYSKFKFESGAHRVQRVPETESSGRIHTSAVTVAVLPEVTEVEADINPNDLRIDTYCASGAGGQYVNRTETAVRITHLPTGIVVQCQDEKSQLKNKEKAMRVLRARVGDAAKAKQERELAADRKSQVGSGDRSERIRTYNFPQNRVTDHRINLTLYKLDSFMEGNLDEIITALTLDSETKRLVSV